MEHAPVTEQALTEVIAAGVAARFHEDGVPPDAIQVHEFKVVEVRDTTMLVTATVDLFIQDGISGIACVELDRWEPSRGRFVSFED